MARSLRLRVFAGPNGSGKTTIIEEVRKARVNGRPVDFGVYINADEIAKALGKGYDLTPFDLELGTEGFIAFANISGLLDKALTVERLAEGVRWTPKRVRSEPALPKDRVAQLIAQFLYDELLKAKRKFSFETVFSHPNKLELMKRAKAAGYKVYLYFVSTETPDINVQRVKEIRVKQGGHDVPRDKIIKRYDRTMGHLNEALGIAYHAYLWDNSRKESRLFCEMKRTEEDSNWRFQHDQIPIWFLQHYTALHPDDPMLASVQEEAMRHIMGMYDQEH
ncbi:MAG TPA: hypothetical protein VGE21_09480 [Flavobacteriales bacterium]